MDWVDRFWSKVVRRGPDECWLWTGGTSSTGYGRFHYSPEHRDRYAHVVSLLIAVGEAGYDRACACHHCDTPLCVNPAHLYWGTQATNVRDMVARGRASGGRAKKVECKKGHPYPPGPRARLRCPICAEDLKRRKQAARRDRYREARRLGFSALESQRLSGRRRQDWPCPVEVEP